MVHLNKNQLPNKKLDELFLQLTTLIGSLNTSQANHFMVALMGTEERIMLAKRLGMVVMLLEGHSMYKVSRVLKVSPSTVEKMKLAMDSKEFDRFIKILKKDHISYQAILETIESFLTVGGIMPRYGQARLPKA